MSFSNEPFGSGFRVTFLNGVTVSIQFGPGAYGDHRWESLLSRDRDRVWESTTAEVAIFNSGGWLTREFKPDIDDDVLGYQTPLQVLEALNWAAQRKGE